ncbi:protein kinase, partial [Myxococcota bacterium]|nr:protein kinase [Myxococcota bacterium]
MDDNQKNSKESKTPEGAALPLENIETGKTLPAGAMPGAPPLVVTPPSHAAKTDRERAELALQETLATDSDISGDATMASQDGPLSISPAKNRAPAASMTHDARYNIRSEVGRGGMGRVLLVHDSLIDREVALKEMFARPGASQEGPAARFIREARLSGRLGHPSIIPVHDMGTRPDGTLFYTMRFVDGQGFDMALKACSSLTERLHFLPNFGDVCNAIAFAHSKNIIHRDLKPANIILGSFGETVVVDWGLAKVLGEADIVTEEQPDHAGSDASTVKTRMGAIMGTPAYMSPEQAVGNQEAIDQRSDQYSLGAILYELLTGRPPYTAASPHALLTKLVTEPLTPVRELAPDAPGELAALAQKALSKDPAARFGSTLDLAREVNAYLSGEKVASYSYSTRELFSRFVKRHKAAVFAAIVVLLALVTAVIFMSVAYKNEVSARNSALAARSKEKRAREAAQRSQKVAETERVKTEKLLKLNQKEQRRAHYSLAQALLDRAILRLKAKAFNDALVLAAAARYHNPVHPRSPWHHGDFHLKQPGAGELLARTDGTLLLAHSSTRILLQRRLTEPRPSTFWNQHFGSQSPLRSAVSPDNRLIALATLTNEVHIHSVGNGKRVLTLKGHKDTVVYQQFSWDNKTFLSAEAGDGARLWSMPGGKLLGTFSFGGGKSAFVKRIPHGRGFLWGNMDGEVWVVEPATPLPRRIIPKNNEHIISICLHGSGKYGVMVTHEGTMSSYEIPSGKRRFSLSLGRKNYYRCCFAREDAHTEAGGGDRLFLVEYLSSRISTWGFSRKTGALHMESRSEPFPSLVTEIGETPSGLWMVATNSGEFSLYDPAIKTSLQWTRGHSSPLSQMLSLATGN